MSWLRFTPINHDIHPHLFCIMLSKEIKERAKLPKPELTSIQFCEEYLQWKYIRKVSMSTVRTPLVTIEFQTYYDRLAKRHCLHQYYYDYPETAKKVYDTIVEKLGTDTPVCDNEEYDPDWKPKRGDVVVVINDNIVII